MPLLRLFLFLILLPLTPLAQAQSSKDELSDTLASIESRIQKIEVQQQEILTRLEKILAELDRLRVWVHRS